MMTHANFHWFVYENDNSRFLGYKENFENFQNGEMNNIFTYLGELDDDLEQCTLREGGTSRA